MGLDTLCLSESIEAAAHSDSEIEAIAEIGHPDEPIYPTKLIIDAYDRLLITKIRSAFPENPSSINIQTKKSYDALCVVIIWYLAGYFTRNHRMFHSERCRIRQQMSSIFDDSEMDNSQTLTENPNLLGMTTSLFNLLYGPQLYSNPLNDVQKFVSKVLEGGSEESGERFVKKIVTEIRSWINAEDKKFKAEHMTKEVEVKKVEEDPQESPKESHQVKKTEVVKVEEPKKLMKMSIKKILYAKQPVSETVPRIPETCRISCQQCILIEPISQRKGLIYQFAIPRRFSDNRTNKFKDWDIIELTHDQVTHLEDAYKLGPVIGCYNLKFCAKFLNLPQAAIKKWFRFRRIQDGKGPRKKQLIE